MVVRYWWVCGSRLPRVVPSMKIDIDPLAEEV